MNNPMLKRAIAVIVLGVFLIQNSVWAVPLEVPLSGGSGFLQIQIPNELASIEEIYEAPAQENPKLILHIQNVHGHYEAQMQIKKLLDYLYQTYAFKLIFVEGAADQLDPSLLKFFPDENANLKFADYMAKMGELTGPEVYVIGGPDDVAAVGIEKTDLYRANYEAFKAVHQASDVTEGFLGQVEQQLDLLSSRFFNQEARRLFGDWKKFESGHRDFLPFVRQLAKDSKKILGLDLESLFAQVEWPQITRLLVLQSMEPEINREKAHEDQVKLLKFLKDKGTNPVIAEAIGHLGERRISMSRLNDPKEHLENLPRYLMERLVDEAGPHGFEFHQYPAFSLYAGYLILQSELDSRALFGEIELLFEKVLNEVTPSELEKNLLELYRDENLLRKLFKLELTRKEWARSEYRKDWMRPESLLSRMDVILKNSDGGDQAVSSRIAADVLNEVTQVFSDAVTFYEVAKARESKFFEKMREEMNTRQEEKAALVTGGFHTDGLMELFRENQMNYGVLMPRLAQKIDNVNYLASMMENRTDLFDLSQLEIANRLSPSLGETGVPIDGVRRTLMTALGASLEAKSPEDLGDLLDAVAQSPGARHWGMRISRSGNRVTIESESGSLSFEIVQAGRRSPYTLRPVEASTQAGSRSELRQVAFDIARTDFLQGIGVIDFNRNVVPVNAAITRLVVQLENQGNPVNLGSARQQIAQLLTRHFSDPGLIQRQYERAVESHLRTFRSGDRARSVRQRFDKTASDQLAEVLAVQAALSDLTRGVEKLRVRSELRLDVDRDQLERWVKNINGESLVPGRNGPVRLVPDGFLAASLKTWVDQTPEKLKGMETERAREISERVASQGPRENLAELLRTETERHVPKSWMREMMGSRKGINDLVRAFDASPHFASKDEITVQDVFSFLLDQTRQEPLITDAQRDRLRDVIYPVMLLAFSDRDNDRKMTGFAYHFHLLGTTLIQLDKLRSQNAVASQRTGEDLSAWLFDHLVSEMWHDLLEDTELEALDIQYVLSQKAFQRIQNLTKLKAELKAMKALAPAVDEKAIESVFNQENYKRMRIGPKTLYGKYADVLFNLRDAVYGRDVSAEGADFYDKFVEKIAGKGGFITELVYHPRLPHDEAWFVTLANDFLSEVSQITGIRFEPLAPVQNLSQNAGRVAASANSLREMLRERFGDRLPSLQEQMDAITSILRDPKKALAIAEQIHKAYYAGIGETAPEFLTFEEKAAVEAGNYDAIRDKVGANLAGLYAVEVGAQILIENNAEFSGLSPLEVLARLMPNSPQPIDDKAKLLMSRLAHLSWKAGQWLRAPKRITRNIMQVTAALGTDLADKEIVKDVEQISANAEVLFDMLSESLAARSELRLGEYDLKRIDLKPGASIDDFKRALVPINALLSDHVVQTENNGNPVILDRAVAAINRIITDHFAVPESIQSRFDERKAALQREFALSDRARSARQRFDRQVGEQLAEVLALQAALAELAAGVEHIRIPRSELRSSASSMPVRALRRLLGSVLAGLTVFAASGQSIERQPKLQGEAPAGPVQDTHFLNLDIWLLVVGAHGGFPADVTRWLPFLPYMTGSIGSENFFLNPAPLFNPDGYMGDEFTSQEVADGWGPEYGTDDYYRIHGMISFAALLATYAMDEFANYDGVIRIDRPVRRTVSSWAFFDGLNDILHNPDFRALAQSRVLVGDVEPRLKDEFGISHAGDGKPDATLADMMGLLVRIVELEKMMRENQIPQDPEAFNMTAVRDSIVNTIETVIAELRKQGGQFKLGDFAKAFGSSLESNAGIELPNLRIDRIEGDPDHVKVSVGIPRGRGIGSINLRIADSPEGPYKADGPRIEVPPSANQAVFTLYSGRFGQPTGFFRAIGHLEKTTGGGSGIGPARSELRGLVNQRANVSGGTVNVVGNKDGLAVTLKGSVTFSAFSAEEFGILMSGILGLPGGSIRAFDGKVAVYFTPNDARSFNFPSLTPAVSGDPSFEQTLQEFGLRSNLNGRIRFTQIGGGVQVFMPEVTAQFEIGPKTRFGQSFAGAEVFLKAGSLSLPNTGTLKVGDQVFNLSHSGIAPGIEDAIGKVLKSRSELRAMDGLRGVMQPLLMSAVVASTFGDPFINAQAQAFDRPVIQQISYADGAANLRILNPIGVFASNKVMYSDALPNSRDQFQLAQVVPVDVQTGVATYTDSGANSARQRFYAVEGVPGGKPILNPLLGNINFYTNYQDLFKGLTVSMTTSQSQPIDRTPILPVPSNYRTWSRSGLFRFQFTADLAAAVNHAKYPIVDAENPQITSDPAVMTARIKSNLQKYKNLTDQFGLKFKDSAGVVRNSRILPEVLLHNADGTYQMEFVNGEVRYASFDDGLTKEVLPMLREVFKGGKVPGLQDAEIVALIDTILADASFYPFIDANGKLHQLIMWRRDGTETGSFRRTNELVDNKHTESRMFLVPIYEGMLGDPANDLDSRRNQGLQAWNGMSLNFTGYPVGTSFIFVGQGDGANSAYTEYYGNALFDYENMAPNYMGASGTNYFTISQFRAKRAGYPIALRGPGTAKVETLYNLFGLEGPQDVVVLSAPYLALPSMGTAAQNNVNSMLEALRVKGTYQPGIGAPNSFAPDGSILSHTAHLGLDMGLALEALNAPVFRALTAEMPVYNFVREQVQSLPGVPAPKAYTDFVLRSTGRGGFSQQANYPGNGVTFLGQDQTGAFTVRYWVDNLNQFAGMWLKFPSTPMANKEIVLQLGPDTPPNQIKVELKNASGAIVETLFSNLGLKPFDTLRWNTTKTGNVTEATIVITTEMAGTNNKGSFNVSSFGMRSRSELRFAPGEEGARDQILAPDGVAYRESPARLGELGLEAVFAEEIPAPIAVAVRIAGNVVGIPNAFADVVEIDRIRTQTPENARQSALKDSFKGFADDGAGSLLVATDELPSEDDLDGIAALLAANPNQLLTLLIQKDGVSSVLKTELVQKVRDRVSNLGGTIDQSQIAVDVPTRRFQVQIVPEMATLKRGIDQGLSRLYRPMKAMTQGGADMQNHTVVILLGKLYQALEGQLDAINARNILDGSELGSGELRSTGQFVAGILSRNLQVDAAEIKQRTFEALQFSADGKPSFNMSALQGLVKSLWAAVQSSIKVKASA